MTAKRLLFVNHSLAMGGIETMLVDMIRLLPKDRFSPEVAVFESGGSLEQVLEQRGIPVHRLDKREGVDAGLFLRLRKLIVDRKIDVVHSHNYSAWIYACVSARSVGGIVHVHTEHSAVENVGRRYMAQRWLSRLTSRVVAVSQHVHDVMINDIGVDKRRIRLVLNGVNTARFAPNVEVRLAARMEIGLSEDEVAIGIVARLVPIKNHALLIRAAAPLIVAGASSARLVIVGDGPERPALEALCTELGVAEKVLFLGERRDTERLLNAMDIYVLSSISEGMNLTLLEAMSASLPVVATDVGGNGEIVEDGVTGHLVALDDTNAMTIRLDQLTGDSRLRREMGDAGRVSIVRRFNEQAMISQYMSLYEGDPG
ncbi:MAG: glycosyltransferase [Betaproteobacteria bacterium]|nr:glycosyltransferase [Betaproteobacteria bacterium]